jgi:DNA polymerase-4
MKRGKQQVAHVTLDNFFEEPEEGQTLEALLSRTARFERCLERHGRGWERPSADEAVLVSSAGTSTLDILDMDWAERLREDIRRSISLDSSVGIASTRLAARISSRMARPRGLLVLLPGYEPQFTSTVPLDELDELRPAQAAALRRRGIKTLGEMAELGSEEARSLLGPEASKLMKLVRGMEDRPDRSRGSRLERAVGLLSRRAARKLCQLGIGARGLELALVYRDGVSLERYSLLPRPISTHVELEVPARCLLRSFPSREEPVVGLSLTFTGLAPGPGQLPLFSRPPVRDVCVRLGRRWTTPAVV